MCAAIVILRDLVVSLAVWATTLPLGASIATILLYQHEVHPLIEHLSLIALINLVHHI